MTRRAPWQAVAVLIGGFVGSMALAEPKHGIAMYGGPMLPPDFVSLPHANPDAPKGGRITFGERGGFDSLHPYILKGRAPWGVRTHTVESLMGRSYDEPFTLYGLLAETIETGPNREWVEFTLRKEAKFSDGSPVTVEDVIWSFETLGTKGHPRYVRSFGKINSIEKTGERSVKFTSDSGDQELPLILGLRPILRKADFETRDFAQSGLTPITGSGPYVIDKFEAGRFIHFKRNPDYWGKDLPLNKGRNNLDEIRYEYFKDGNVIFEAFKAGEISSYRETSGAKWDTLYDFDRVTNGGIQKSIIPHKRPSGMKGLVMNTRRDQFKDWRVREALIQAFDYHNFNQKVYSGTKVRFASYFGNSSLGMAQGAAEGRVKELLMPFADSLVSGTLEGYEYPVSDGKRNRKGLRQALKLMAEAGWSLNEGKLQNADGEPFKIEILLRTGSSEEEAITNIYADALQRIGVMVDIKSVESGVYRERQKAYDYDMTPSAWNLSLSPGNEQKLYWGKNGVTEPGTRNYMGAQDAAIEPLIDHMLNATDQGEFVAATKALDRVLTAGRYVVPFGYDQISRLAHDSSLKYPERIQIYGDWPGFQPEVWWSEK